MRKHFGLMILSLMLVTQGFAKTLPDVRNVITLQELTTGDVQELIQGLHPEVAIKCEEGSTIPLEFVSKFPFFSAKFTPNVSVQVDKLCYFRFCKKKVYMSYDLKSWERPESCDGAPKVEFKFNDKKPGLIVEATLSPSED